MATKFGTTRTAGNSAVATSKLSSSGFESSTGEKLKLQIGQIKSPDIIALAQVMRAVKASDNSGAPNRPSMSENLIPVMTPVSTDKFVMKTELTISADLLVDPNSFFLEVDVRDAKNTPHCKKMKKINHGAALKRYHTVTIPPQLVSSSDPDGAVYLEITQKDPVATIVELYMRNITISGGPSFSRLLTIDIKKSDGPKIIKVEQHLAGTVLIRGIPMCGSSTSGIFSDIVVTPFVAAKETQSKKLVTGTIHHDINSEGIFVKATSIVGNANFACLVRREINSANRKFEKLNDYEHVRNSTMGIEYQDNNVQIEHTYEYRLLFLLPDGTEVLSQDSAIVKRVQIFPTPKIKITQFATTPTNSAGQFGVKFYLSVSRNSTTEGVIFNTLKKMGMSSEYITEISEAKDMASKLYMFHVTRKNLVTGKNIDLGYYSPGAFSDAGGISSKTPLPYIGHAYEYRAELLCRDAMQVIEEIKNTKSFRQASQYDQTPLMGKAQTSENAKFDPNNKSKFFSQSALIQSTLSTGNALIKNHAGGTLGLSKTGYFESITVSIPKKDDVKIKEPTTTADEFGDVHITWRMIGYGQVDHFIIRSSRPGYSHPCGVCHHLTSGGKYSYVDRSQKAVPGVITYTITPVMLDFSHGKSTEAGKVIVVGS